MPDDTDPGAPRGAGTDDDEGAPGAGPGDITGAVPARGGGTTPGGDDTRAMSADEVARELAADDATAAVPAGDATAAVPAGDATRAMARSPRPPDAAGTGRETHRAARGGLLSPANRMWLIGIVVAAVVLAGAGVALGLSGGTTNTRDGASGTTTPVAPASTTPTGPPCPLTGVPSSGPQVPARPALAVKVDNYPQARPQSGLDKADIVYEEPVEGGITRLVAVFQCQSPSLVGPIRSARAVDVQILDELSKPVFIHAGGIDPVLSLLANGNLTDDNVFTHGSIVQTPPGRSAPYDTYVSAAAAWGLDPRDTTPPAPVFGYSTTAPAGTAVSSVHIPFAQTNSTLWTWSSAKKQWLLSYSGSPATDADGGGQISTTNVVVQTVRVTYGPWLENDVGGYEVQSQMTGSGPLKVFRNGTMITGTWARSSYSSPTTLTASDGSPITLQPGPTWVEIVPSGIPVTTTAPTTTGTATG